MLATDTRKARVSRARLTAAGKKHPFVAALVERGMTVKEAATELGYSRSTVQSWYDAGDNGRPIPRAAAAAIEAKWGVPASVWHRITE